MEVFGPIVDQMKATHGKFTAYMYDETLAIGNMAFMLCGFTPRHFLCYVHCIVDQLSMKVTLAANMQDPAPVTFSNAG